MIDPGERRRLRRAIRARREQLTALGGDAYAELRREVRAGAFGPVPDGEGWLHEDFHLADKDAVFAAARAGQRIGADGIVAASRLYTPEPIVQVILQNTLGALWLQMYPDSPLAQRWELLIPEVVGERRPPRPVRDLRLCDPCVGGGAFLMAAFDMFIALYEDERRAAAAGAIPASWSTPANEAPRSAVQRNLWGADLDSAAVAIVAQELGGRGGAAAVNVRALAPPLGSLDSGSWPPQHFDVVCTNPPWIGFRQLDRTVKQAVCAAVTDAVGDLAVATQSRCFDLVAPGGRVGTVTPAAWLVGREARPLRRRILAAGGPVAALQLGQGVFDQAPLVYVAVTIIERGATTPVVAVARGRGGWEGAAIADVLGERRLTERAALAAAEDAPFAPAAPPALLAQGAAATRRIGTVATTADGVWTGSNARDVRYWWECSPQADVAALSGGQGYQRWAAPTMLRIPSAVVAGRESRAGCLEYARVAGGRLGVRVVQPGTAALAGVVTIVPASPGDAAEILAVANSRIGAAWVATLSAGLNFNPGYLARIPMGPGPIDDELRQVVDQAVALRRQALTADPTHDGFHEVPNPWEAGADAQRLRALEARVDVLVARHLGLPEGVIDQLPPLPAIHRRGTPIDDFLVVAVLRSLGFAWPGHDPGPPPPQGGLTGDDLADVVADTLRRAGAPAGVLDPAVWVHTRLERIQHSRFRQRPVLTRDGERWRLTERVWDPASPAAG